MWYKDEKIILEPIQMIPKEEQWLFDPKNKTIINELKAALKEKAHIKIDLSQFKEE